MEGFIFDFSGGSNTDEYSTFMKEVLEYIRRKLIYGAYIKRYLKSEMNTRVPMGTTENYPVISFVLGKKDDGVCQARNKDQQELLKVLQYYLQTVR